MLEELHQSHPGMSRMKRLARGYIWWPHMDADIENKVKSCTKVGTCECTILSMGVARKAMETTPHRLCRSLHG